jgi:hypothetical protein
MVNTRADYNLTEVDVNININSNLIALSASILDRSLASVDR